MAVGIVMRMTAADAVRSEGESSRSPTARMGKRGRSSATKSHRCQHAPSRVAGLNIAAVLNRVSPQGRIGAVARSILELAFLEYDFDSACYRFHRDFEAAWQARLMVCRLERSPCSPASLVRR